MTKKTLEQVREARTSGKNFVFNMTAAIQAAEATPARTKSGASSTGVFAQLKELVEAIGHPVSCNQIQAAWKAATGEDHEIKWFCDRLWHCAVKQGTIQKLGGGVYAPLGYSDATSDASDAVDTDDVVAL